MLNVLSTGKVIFISSNTDKACFSPPHKGSTWPLTVESYIINFDSNLRSVVMCVH